MANVKIPYSLIPAVPLEVRRENMKKAIARGLPRLEREPRDDVKTMHIACFGPSLRQTWETLRDKRPIIAMSGATKWLAEHGIIADFAIEMDPRESQLTVSLPPVPGVTYLIASCVIPAFFDRVLEAGNRVVLWHTVSSNFEDELQWVAQHDENQFVVHGGSTVGLTAIHIAGVMGYTRFEIHGMDGSFGDDGVRHAGHHGGKEQPNNVTWDAGGKRYGTSKIMANAVAETINTAKNFPIITVWHGEGLTQALIREANLTNAACADEAEKVIRLRGLRPRVVMTPPMPRPGKRSFWDAILPMLWPTDLAEIVQNIAICEPRRERARFNTGTIPFETAVYLRALSRFYQPEVIAEVGTFIGTSTLALAPQRVIYTCDSSNDCVPSTESIITHPYQTSAQMLREIQEPVDFFFFDGRLKPDDLPEIKRLMHDRTVFVFDDYAGNKKGVANVHLLAPLIPTHTLIPPADGPSTLAVGVPFMETKEVRR
jgi:Protein of unknown function DUF115